MKAQSLSKREIDVIKIVLAILEGYDTFNNILRYTNLSKWRVRYLLHLLEKAGLVYKKDGTKQWRVRANYLRIWKNAEYVYYIKKEKVMDEFEPIKE